MSGPVGSYQGDATKQITDNRDFTLSSLKKMLLSLYANLFWQDGGYGEHV